MVEVVAAVAALVADAAEVAGAAEEAKARNYLVWTMAVAAAAAPNGELSPGVVGGAVVVAAAEFEGFLATDGSHPRDAQSDPPNQCSYSEVGGSCLTRFESFPPND